MGARGTAPSPAHPAVKATGQKQDWTGYLFISPAVALFLMLIVGPFTFAIVLSFYSWDLLTPRPVHRVGQLPRDVAGPAAAQGAAQHVRVRHRLGRHARRRRASLIALGVNQLKNRYLSYFVRTSLFFPFVISWAAVALLWRYVLSPLVRDRFVLLREARLHPARLVQRPDVVDAGDHRHRLVAHDRVHVRDHATPGCRRCPRN